MVQVNSEKTRLRTQSHSGS